MKVSKI